MSDRELLEKASNPAVGAWDGAEEWERLAWALCAEEHGEEACTELIWEGGAIPEPWGDRWLKYEGEAKRMISLVREHAPAGAHTANAPEKWVRQVMEQAQVFASAWALVGSRFDSGGEMDNATAEKEHLRKMLSVLPSTPPTQDAQWPPIETARKDK